MTPPSHNIYLEKTYPKYFLELITVDLVTLLLCLNFLPSFHIISFFPKKKEEKEKSADKKKSLV